VATRPRRNTRVARPEQVERAPDAARQRFLERRRGAVHAELGVAELREALDVGGVERVELRLQLLDRRAGTQAAEVKEAIARAGAVGLLFGGERQRNPELDALRGAVVAVVALLEEGELARHHADDRVRMAGPRQPERAADDRRVAAVHALPEGVAQDDLLVVAHFAFGVGEGTAEDRRRAQDAEQRRRRAHAAQLLRHAVDAHRIEPIGEQALFFQRGQRLAPIEVGRHVVRQDVVGGDGRVDVAQADQPIGFGHGQRPEQHGVDHREDGDIGAETDGQRHNDGGAEAGLVQQQPRGVAQVADGAGRQRLAQHPDSRWQRWSRGRAAARGRQAEQQWFAVEQLVGQRPAGVHLPLDLVPRVGVAAAVGAQRIVEVFELGGPLVDDLLLAVRRQRQRLHLVPHQCGEITHSRARPPAARPE
jgi:hypothetical protein